MDGEFLPRNRVEPLHQEANELTAIFVVSIRTAKSTITNQKSKEEKALVFRSILFEIQRRGLVWAGPSYLED